MRLSGFLGAALLGVALLGLHGSSAPSAAAGVTEIDRVTMYAISGSTRGELRREMDLKGPHGFDAETTWHVTPVFSEVAGRCDPKLSSVRLDVSFTFPSWADSSKGSSVLQALWSFYEGALRTHEAGHRDHGVEAAKALVARVRGFSPSSCESLRQQGQKAAEQIARASAAEDVSYDEWTQHGALQGAIWPGGF